MKLKSTRGIMRKHYEAMKEAHDSMHGHADGDVASFHKAASMICRKSVVDLGTEDDTEPEVDHSVPTNADGGLKAAARVDELEKQVKEMILRFGLEKTSVSAVAPSDRAARGGKLVARPGEELPEFGKDAEKESLEKSFPALGNT